MSCCTVWLKTLNLALMGGTPQYIHLNFVVLVFTVIFLFNFRFLYYFWVFFAETNGLFSSSLGVCYEPRQSNKFSNFQSRSARSINSTLGTMFSSSLGEWEHSFTHRVS
jgi:hypothetical protein